MATENSISISIKSSDSEDDISTTELIKNIQNNANCTQILSESENEIDEESWISYMKYLKKNILKDTSPIQKRKKYLNELTLESDEEHMLKNQNYDMSQLHDEDPNELMQEIEKNLNESFFSSMLSIPQGSSSPKLLSHIKSKENNSDSLHEIMSSRIYNYGENPSLNISESIGYHSFKSEHKSLISFSQIKDQLQPTIVDNIKTKNNLIKLSDSEEDVNISPIIISLLTSSSDDEEDHKSISFEKETEFNECKTDEISLKLKNLKVAAVKPNIILESTENEPTSINTISNDLISTELINNESPFISRINPFKTPLSIKSPLKSNNTSVKISKTKKRRRQRKTKTKKRKAAAKLEKNIQNEQNSSSLKSPETEIELPSAGKRTKINDKGKFLTKTPELIKVTKEKRKNKLKYSKSIKFIAGGIVQYGTKDNNINITDKLKFNEKRMTDNKEYENELKKLLNTIGGEMILKMGYQIGKGLGKSSQGIQRPIEAYIRKGRGSIGKYGSEMSLPTSIKIQEKQYSILKALGKSELDIEENKKKINKKEPGIYSTINYDYSNLQYSFEINNNNNNNNNIKENNYNEIMIDPLLNEKYSNIIVEFDNNIENNNQTTLIKQLNQFKDIRKIINCNLLQLCVFNASGQHLTSNQLQQLKTNLEKTIINTILDSNNKLSCIQFESIYIDIINGCLLLNCANEITYNWIEKLLIISPSHNFLPNVNLLIKNFQNSISLIYHMEIFIPGENLMTIEYLKILENQNPGLITKKWKIYKRNDLKDSVHLEFGITEESYKVLENTYNFRPYLILGRIQFYPIDVKYY